MAQNAISLGIMFSNNFYLYNNPVASHFLLGQKIGITGTPALILEDGALLPGYSPAAELLTIMGLDENSDG